jgi:hypothetical protein
MTGNTTCGWTVREADGPTSLVAGTVSAAVLAVAFGGLALGVEAWWLAFPLGYGAVLPLSVGLAQHWQRRRAEPAAPTEPTPDPTETRLAEVRARYARGDLDETELEARLEAVLTGAAADDPVRRNDARGGRGATVGDGTAAPEGDADG